ncbi:hypothetical protein [Nocardia harenae]|uniref:hypothetical protein n=1 Tax=Nocardia harenae TaxID=358707 RepID=UPI0012EEC649|nr:hypothetical protein [Nocardia harenae]
MATDSLRNEAGVWIRESDTLASVSDSIGELKFNRTEAGIFQIIVSAHSKVVESASARCREGAAAFTETGLILRKVADIYDEEERTQADRLNNIW